MRRARPAAPRSSAGAAPMPERERSSDQNGLAIGKTSGGPPFLRSIPQNPPRAGQGHGEAIREVVLEAWSAVDRAGYDAPAAVGALRICDSKAQRRRPPFFRE